MDEYTFNEIFDFLVRWAPTILFIFLVLSGGIIGILRGFRKSIIMLIHSLVAFIICLIIYFVIVNMDFVDKLLLDMVNLILGDGRLQNMLDVSTSCSTMKEVLLEYIIYNGNYGDVLSLVIKDNGAYVATIVDMAYRIVAALAMYLIYFILVFMMYMAYLVFYPERKYKKKKKAAFIESKADRNYAKHEIAGGIIGVSRGLLSAIILLSFIGSLFYIAAGGKGEGTVEDISFGTEQIDVGYDAYRSIESYGAQGIYKVFNALDDKNETPYYLYVADIVMQGELNDESRGVNENVILREELSTYTRFARQSFNLFMKYGGEDIKSVILSKTDDEMLDVILDVMLIPEFQEEFTELIKNFESTVYISNLTLSLLDSIIANIDNKAFSESLNSEALEIIKILFKKGHLSTYIPSENKLYQEVLDGADSSLDKYNLPHISTSKLIAKEDVVLIFEVVMKCLSINQDENEEYVLEMVDAILPNIEDLSILDDERKTEFNPVLARLYAYLENRYLESSVKDENNINGYLNDTSIDWVFELKMLVSSAVELLDLYENIYDEEKDELTMILDIFDPNSENYEVNVAIYDKLLANVTSSRLLGNVLSTKLIFNSITEGLKSITNNLVIEEDIVFENTYDSNGNVIYGEGYQLLSAIKLLGDPENRQIIDNLMNSEGKNITDILNDVSVALFKKDENGNVLIDYLLNSRIVSSVLSAYLIEQKNISSTNSLYIPDEVLKTDDDGNRIAIIEDDVLRDLFYKLPDLLDKINPILENPNNTECLVSLLKDETLNEMLDNLIIEGTISSFAITYFIDSDTIILPNSLKDVDDWISKDNKDGELKKFVNLINETNINIEVFINDSTQDEMINEITKIDSNNSKLIIDSKLLYYTISNYLIKTTKIGDIDLIIPMSSRVLLEDEAIEYLINDVELINLISKLNLFVDTSNSTLDSILKDFVINRNLLITSKIVLATFVNYIVNNEQFTKQVGNTLIIPDNLKVAGNKENLLNLSEINLWNNEAVMLLQAIDELFNISSREDELSFDDETLATEMKTTVRGLNDNSSIVLGKTRLEVCYESSIIVSSISKILDDGFNTLIDEDSRGLVKVNGVYPYKEIKALVNLIYIFGIDLNDQESINSVETTIVNDILTYNEPRQEERFNGMSTLEILCESRLVRKIITKSIDEQINPLVDNINDCNIVKDNYKAYTYDELSALIEALKVLDISNIKDEINMEYNVFNLTNDEIDVLYQSYIAIYMINKALDDALLGDRKNIKDDLIVENTLYNDVIKTNNGLDITKYYLNEEIKDLLEALDELGIDTFESLNGFDFEGSIPTLNNASKKDNTKTRLDVLYESSIISAVLTKMILDEANKDESLLMHHPFAYMDNVDIYRRIEIESLIEILGDKKISEFSADELTLQDIKPYIYNENNQETKSYLMVATISYNIFKVAELKVPSHELDRHVEDVVVITPKALADLIDACKYLGIESADFDMSSITAPKDEGIDIVLNSSIARATITYNIVIQQSENTDNVTAAYSVEEDILKTTDHLGNTILVLTEDALRKLFKAVDIISDGKLQIQIDIEKIKEKYEASPLEVIEALDSTLVRIAVSDSIINNYDGNELSYIVERLTVYDLSIPSRTFTRDVIPKDYLLDALEMI